MLVKQEGTRYRREHEIMNGTLNNDVRSVNVKRKKVLELRDKRECGNQIQDTRRRNKQVLQLQFVECCLLV